MICALLRCLRHQRVGSFETIEIIARIFRCQLARETRCFRKALLACVKDDQQCLGFAINPTAFFGYALERCEAALFGTAKAQHSRSDLHRQRQCTDRVIIQTDRELSIAIRRIELDYFTMLIDSIRAILQGSKMAPLDRFLERSFQSFDRAHEIQRFRVLWKLFQARFGKHPRLARESSKLIDNAWIGFVVAR